MVKAEPLRDDAQDERGAEASRQRQDEIKVVHQASPALLEACSGRRPPARR